MTFLERIQIQRADEQCASVNVAGETGHHDPWAVRPCHYEIKIRAVPRARCLAGDCSREVRSRGYCSHHWDKVLNGIDLSTDGISSIQDGVETRR